jgi:ATP-dependent Clp protease ATP-binding subunit ClpA
MKKIIALFTALLCYQSLFAADIGQNSDYLILTEAAVQHYEQTASIVVKKGVYLAATEDIVLGRTDLNSLIDGSIWTTGEGDDRLRVILGYAPGILQDTQNEVWAKTTGAAGGKFFPISDQSREDLRLSPTIPSKLIPAYKGFYSILTDMSLSFTRHGGNINANNSIVDKYKIVNDKSYSLSGDGTALLYLGTDGAATDEKRAIILYKNDGTHKVVTDVTYEGSNPLMAFNGDAVYVQDGEDKVKIFVLDKSGNTIGTNFFKRRNNKQKFVFRGGNAMLAAPKAAGGTMYFYITTEGRKVIVPNGSRGGKLSADDRKALQSLGEDWGRKVQLGSFSKYVPNKNAISKALLGIKGNTYTWTSVVGESGVGKTSFLKSLASEIYKLSQTDVNWKDYEIFHIPMYTMVELLNAEDEDDKGKKNSEPTALDKLQTAIFSKKVVVFVDNLLDDAQLGATNTSKAMDTFLSLFRGAIESGKLKVVTASKKVYWERITQGNAGLFSNLAHEVYLSAPKKLMLKRIVIANISRISKEYKVKFATGVADVVVELAGNLYPDLVEPSRSIKVLDQLGRNFGNVSATRHHEVSSNAAYKFLKELMADTRVLDTTGIEDFLDLHLIGQSPAKDILYKKLNNLGFGHAELSGPLGLFFLVGPTGVGKTYTADLVADFLDIPKLAIDMNFFRGFRDNSELSNKIRSLSGKPFILIMDDIDKHEKGSELLSELRGMLDSGVYAKGTKDELNFHNAIIFVTGNYGAQVVLDNPSEDHQELLIKVRDYVLDQDTEEEEQIPVHVWSRIQNSVIVYKGLNDGELFKIGRKYLAELSEKFERSDDLKLNVSDALIDFIVATNLDKKTGAVPVMQTLRDLMRNEIPDYLVDLTSIRRDKIRQIYVTVSRSGDFVILDDQDSRWDRIVGGKK